jgi:ribonuclease HI
MQWLPSHCGIERNERADRLAKDNAKRDQLNEMQNQIVKNISGIDS